MRKDLVSERAVYQSVKEALKMMHGDFGLASLSMSLSGLYHVLHYY